MSGASIIPAQRGPFTDTTHVIALHGLEARVTLSHGVHSVTAHGICFDENGDIVTETDGRQFMDYCDAEIVYLIADEMMTTRRQIESSDVWDALPIQCECEDDDE